MNKIFLVCAVIFSTSLIAHAAEPDGGGQYCVAGCDRDGNPIPSRAPAKATGCLSFRYVPMVDTNDALGNSQNPKVWGCPAGAGGVLWISDLNKYMCVREIKTFSKKCD